MNRCEWAKGALMTEYHDTEWGVAHHDDRDLFELLILEGAQAGLSREIVLRKGTTFARPSTGSTQGVSQSTTRRKLRRSWQTLVSSATV